MVPGVEASRIQHVFELELKRGCDNQLVIGGLDRMLIQMAEDGVLQENPGLARRVTALPAGGYRSLDEAGRRAWIEDTLSALRSGTPAPPARVAAPPAARQIVRHSRPARGRAGASAGEPAPVQRPAHALEPSSPVTRLQGIGSSA